MKNCLLLLLFLLGATCGQAQVSLQVSSDTSLVHIGDTFELKVVWAYDKEARVEEPLTDSLRQVPDLQIRRESAWGTEHFNGTVAKTKTFTCAYMNVGLLRIPMLAAPYTFGPRKGNALSEALLIQVAPLAPKQDEILPIKDAIFEPRNVGDYLPWILGGLALAALAAYLVLRWKRRPKKTKAQVIIAADTLALEQIQALRLTLPWEKSELAARYTSLTDILRSYLQVRFEIPATVETYRQISRMVLQLRRPPEGVADMLQALQTAEIVKFAKVEAGPEVHQEVLDRIEHFVRSNPMPVTNLKTEKA